MDSARIGSHHDVITDLGDLEELSLYNSNLANITPSLIGSLRKGATISYMGEWPAYPDNSS